MPRARVPVRKDGDCWGFASVAIRHCLERKFPEPTLFGGSAETGGVSVRIIEAFQRYIAPRAAAAIDAIEGRPAKSECAGHAPSVADVVIDPWMALLRNALRRPAGAELRAFSVS